MIQKRGRVMATPYSKTKIKMETWTQWNGNRNTGQLLTVALVDLKVYTILSNLKKMEIGTKTRTEKGTPLNMTRQ